MYCCQKYVYLELISFSKVVTYLSILKCLCKEKRFSVYEIICLLNVPFIKSPMYKMFYIWNVISINFFYEMSCLWNVLSINILSMKCPAYEMSCPWIYEISCLWNVLSLKCPVFEMSCLWNVLSMKCHIYEFMKGPVYEMSCLWNVLSIKCPVYEMSSLWNVLSMKCPVYEMSCLWNVLSMILLYMKCNLTSHWGNDRSVM